MKNTSLQNTLKDTSRASLLLEEMIVNEIDFDGIDIEVKGVKTDIINRLVDAGVIDYDELQGVLTLEYQTEDFLKYIKGSIRDTNIESIDKQVKEIEKALQDARKRIAQQESFEKEKKNIIKRLRKIPGLLKDNYKSIKNTSVFTFQTERNINIKKTHLLGSKKEIGLLVNAITDCENTIVKKRKSIYKIVQNQVILDSFFSSIIDIRKSIIQTRKEILLYLGKTLENESLIKKIKKLGVLHRQGLLFERTNIEEVLLDYKGVKSKDKVSLLHDNVLIDFQEALRLELEKKKIVLTKKVLSDNQKKEALKIDREKKTKEIKVIDKKRLYKKFSSQEELNLVEFLLKEQVPPQKISPLVSRFIIDRHITLTIDCDNRVICEDRTYPTIYNNIRK